MTISVKPIKRSKALVRFSQEHHYNLLLVWKVKEGLRHNIDLSRISDYIIYFYDEDLLIHFKNEEADLFAILKEDHPLLIRAIEEHQQLCEIVEKIRIDKYNLDLIKKFSELLEKHIRFEERLLFNYLESKYSEMEVIKIGEKYKGKPIDVSDDWEDKFWITKK